MSATKRKSNRTTAPTGAKSPPSPLRSGESTSARLFGSCALAIETAPATEADASLRPFRGLLYSGAAVRTWFGKFVIDLASLKLPAEGEKLPALYGHFGPVGYLTRAALTQRGLEVEGNLITRGDSEAAKKAREIAELADAGFPWQMSAGIDMTVRLVDTGDRVTVNGTEHEGPVWVASSSRLREGSFVELGADADTSTAVLRIAEGTHDMSDTAALETIDSDAVTVEWLKANKPELVAAIKAEEADETADMNEAADPVPDQGAAMAAAPTPEPATVDQLSALPGAGDAFVVAQMKARATLAEAQAALMVTLAAERDEARARLAAAVKGTATDPINAGDPPPATAGRFEGAAGADPAQDWANSAALRAHWTGRTRDHDETVARRAFLKFAEAQRERRESWLDA